MWNRENSQSVVLISSTSLKLKMVAYIFSFALNGILASFCQQTFSCIVHTSSEIAHAHLCLTEKIFDQNKQLENSK